MIISEAWIGYGSENRDSIIARSGPVPRVYQVPIGIYFIILYFKNLIYKNFYKIALSAVFG